MPTTLTLMALALFHQLQKLGYQAPPQQDCEAIMRHVVEQTTAMGEKMEREAVK